MIGSIRQFFEKSLQQGTSDVAPSDHALQLATAALLLEVARSDYCMDDKEMSQIENAIQTTFGLSEAETNTLVQLADKQSKLATSLHGFTSLINNHWPLEQRVKVIELMWQVAYADDQLDKHENHLLRKVGGLLYVPHKQFIAAKLRAKQGAVAHNDGS